MKEIVVLHYPDVRRPNWTLLSEAARRRNISLITWEPHRLVIHCSDRRIRGYYDGAPERPRVIIHRTVSSFRGIVTPALAWWASSGTKILNKPEAAYRSRDKLLTTMSLCHAGVPIVSTLAFVEASDNVLRTVSDSRRLILKPAHGVCGRGIHTFASVAELLKKWDPERGAQPEHLMREHYLVQPLVCGGGRDIRAFVVDGVCVALMQRVAQPGEARANLALGATPMQLSLTHPATSTAVAALQACQLDYGGVDLIEDEQGAIRVLEVDAWAGFAGITAATGQDVAGHILDLAVKLSAA